MKYIRDFDSEIFNEEDVSEAVDESITMDDLEEAMQNFSFLTLFNHLDDEMKDKIWDMAHTAVFEEHFSEVDEDEEDDYGEDV